MASFCYKIDSTPYSVVNIVILQKGLVLKFQFMHFLLVETWYLNVVYDILAYHQPLPIYRWASLCRTSEIAKWEWQIVCLYLLNPPVNEIWLFHSIFGGIVKVLSALTVFREQLNFIVFFYDFTVIKPVYKKRPFLYFVKKII